jgi:hypothetical protein
VCTGVRGQIDNSLFTNMCNNMVYTMSIMCRDRQSSMSSFSLCVCHSQPFNCAIYSVCAQNTGALSFAVWLSLSTVRSR